MRVFIDTNIWVYRLDRRDPEKSRFIKEWLHKLADNNEIVVSTQVLIELRSVLTRKLKPALPEGDILAALKAVAAFEVISTDVNLILDANQLAQQKQLSWFDALILEAAIRSHCDALYSEDFSHEQTIEGVKILNPFMIDEDQF